MISAGIVDFPQGSSGIVRLKIGINIYLLIVIAFHCPVVMLQDYS